jgi:hypothetical protein
MKRSKEFLLDQLQFLGSGLLSESEERELVREAEKRGIPVPATSRREA